MNAPFPSSTPKELNALRLQLHSNGYDPLPIIGAHIVDDNAGKRPKMPGWQNQQKVDPAKSPHGQPTRANAPIPEFSAARSSASTLTFLNEELSAKT